MPPPSPPADVAPRCRAIDGPWLGHAAGRRLIFLHIPKTAGTAITSFLRQQFAEADVMPQLQANFHRSHPLWPLVARRYRLLGVGMHLDHDRVAALARGLAEEAPPFLLTVLREPRARLLSRYKEWRSTPDEHMQAARDHVKDAILTARTKSFSEFLHSDNPVVVSTLDNLQARLIAGLNLSRKLSSDELLARARHNLGAYDLVGTTASCDDTLQLLAHAYGWPQPAAALPRVHQSQPVSEDTLRTSDADEERIATYTVLDQALWDDLCQGTLQQGSTAEASLTRQQRPAFLDVDFPTRCEGSPPPAYLSFAASTPLLAEEDNLGPGAPTVRAIVAEYAPQRVFGLGRKRWYPAPDDDPQPLEEHEKVVIVVRFSALSHQRSYVIRRGCIPLPSLLAITEVDDGDPRLLTLLAKPQIRACVELVGSGPDAVLVVAVGRLRNEGGAELVDLLLETLERFGSTHPTAVAALHDAPASRMLAAIELTLCLRAVLSLLEQPTANSPHAATLATLHPEDHDPLQASSPQSADTLLGLGEQLAAARTAADAAPTSLTPPVHDLLRQASETPPHVYEHGEACDLPALVDAYTKVFNLLSGLTRLRNADRT